MQHLTLSDFIDYDPVTLRICNREGTQREFKSLYESSKVARYLKTLVAFANHRGGALLFGISDTPRSIIGIHDAAIPDAADWQKRLRSYFEPAIFAEAHTFEISHKAVVIVSVNRSAVRPVICTRDANDTVLKRGRSTQISVLQQGAIYFRYSGTSDHIRFAELNEILRDREDKRIKAFLENVRIMNRLGGPEAIGIVNLKDTAQIKDGAQIYLSEQAAKNLNVVERGRFVESKKDGDPAYFIVGTVRLNQIVKEPLGDEDKNTPTEAALQIKPTVQQIYGKNTEFLPQHLAKAAEWLGIRTKTKCDSCYVIDEKKLGRQYYTRDGISFVKREIAARPLEAIRKFGAKSAIAAYEATMVGDTEISEPQPRKSDTDKPACDSVAASA